MSAEVYRLGDVEPRFGDWGPGYATKHDDAAFGTVVLRPGDDFGNHLHNSHTESFVVLQGVAEVWLNRSTRVVIQQGDLLRAEPGEEHYVRNSFSEPFKALFIKTPWVDGDKVDLPWTPDSN